MDSAITAALTMHVCAHPAAATAAFAGPVAPLALCKLPPPAGGAGPPARVPAVGLVKTSRTSQMLSRSLRPLAPLPDGLPDAHPRVAKTIAGDNSGHLPAQQMDKQQEQQTQAQMQQTQMPRLKQLQEYISQPLLMQTGQHEALPRLASTDMASTVTACTTMHGSPSEALLGHTESFVNTALLQVCRGENGSLTAPPSTLEAQLLGMLRAWRVSRARQSGKQPSSVVSDTVLKAVAECQPLSFLQLQQVIGRLC
eukprot:364100-Chlamydomonas_euryale.AAC.33